MEITPFICKILIIHQKALLSACSYRVHRKLVGSTDTANGSSDVKLLLNLDRRGFTFIELMVALAIGSVIVIGIYSTYTGQQRINQAQDQVVEIQQNLRAGLDMMSRELRMAGFDPDGKKNVGFTVARETLVTFTMRADGDGRNNDNDLQRDELDEYTDAAEQETVTEISYFLDDAYNDGIPDLVRTVGYLGALPGPSIALIENVENVEFIYILRNGDLRFNLTSQEELSEIRSVKISVLVRSSGVSLNYRNTLQYPPGSSTDLILGPIASWDPGPFNDNIRRRMQIITVECRNML
ncbi:MAG: prepilin-type N-terminal cleavage/methylation domain-containing protein [Candidatus Electrothrix sp. AX5]|nr:prepilin-type N-terminal cleavage/methylation domain-containing protein [Candidatus Electrothrix sp. AX5]